MFFGGDGSTYVAVFCDIADLVVKMSMPENHEVIRINAGDFLLNTVRKTDLMVLLERG